MLQQSGALVSLSPSSAFEFSFHGYKLNRPSDLVHKGEVESLRGVFRVNLHIVIT
ncbi:hypothetical protein Hanom_Chr14g01315501 [Helianthus anomalus]